MQKTTLSLAAALVLACTGFAASASTAPSLEPTEQGLSTLLARRGADDKIPEGTNHARRGADDKIPEGANHARRGRGADDAAGDDHGHHGNHHARRGRGADDAAGDDRGNHGANHARRGADDKIPEGANHA